MFTTNYDNLIELGWSRQLGQAGVKNLTLAFEPKHLSVEISTPLFKPHGSVEYAKAPILSGGLVLSMFDYFEVIGSYQSMIRRFIEDFTDRCVLFVGYSFMDMDIGAEIFRLRQQDRGVHWYAVFPRDDDDVRAMYKERFAIRQINRTFFDFLTDLDSEVGFIGSASWKSAEISRLRNEGLIQ